MHRQSAYSVVIRLRNMHCLPTVCPAAAGLLLRCLQAKRVHGMCVDNLERLRMQKG